MRKKIGIGCIAVGMICLLIAVAFVVYNRYEAARGEKMSQTLLQNLQTNLHEAKQSERIPEEAPLDSISRDDAREMMTTQVGNYDSIGILSIPVLELELPVLTEWNYEKLKNAPCHYYGSYYQPDFVIAAHNYPSHFGRLSQLQAGDLVFFTDVTGSVHCYEVVLLETLSPNATEAMITSGFDLSLYTCTPGGGSRVTVRCNAVKDRELFIEK